LGWCVVIFCRRGDEELGPVAHNDCCVAVSHEIHNGVLYYGIREGVASDVASSSVPLEKLDIGNEDTVSTPACKYLVSVWHVDKGPALCAVLVADVETDVVFDVELPFAFMVLEREAEQVAECEAILMVCIDGEGWVDDASWC